MRIGIDIGGTFTDFTVVREDGEVVLWKEDSTPADPLEAIEKGLPALAGLLGMTTAEMLAATDLLVHGSTIGTNTLIQKNGGPIGLLATKGFRDVIYYRDGFKPERFNVHRPRPFDFVDRYLRLSADERILSDGSVRVPLHEESVREAAATYREVGVGAVAVAFLWSVMNDTHERRAAEILAEELPGVPILCSSDVLPEIREWERTSATVLSAYMLPKIGDYLRGLERMLQEGGAPRGPQIMQCNGGCSAVSEIMRRPVLTLHSGPAAAPAASLHHAAATGIEDLISIDMGGTSFDVCLIRGGRAAMSRELMVEEQPIGVPAVEVHSIGAGGGSLAWIDDGGALRVGPDSAGAVPGPACYGQGGARPTVTDANVALGYLSPEAFLGGRRRLDDEASRAAIDREVGEPLGLDTIEAAAGIIELVDSNMMDGVRKVSVERGIDPRSYALVSGGGAGGLHAARIARRLHMARLVIPRETSTFCAFGMTVTDVRHDYSYSAYLVSDEMDLSVVSDPYARMEAEALARLQADGFGPEDVVFERSVDARYQNQVHELTIQLPSGGYDGAMLEELKATFHDEHHRAHAGQSSDELDEIVAAFHEAHQETYTYSLPEAPIEFLHWRLTAIGRTGQTPRQAEEVASDPEAAAAAALTGERPAYFEELGGMVDTPIYDADALKAGAIVEGHAILVSPTTTIVINPGDVLEVLPGGTFSVTVAQPVATGAETVLAEGELS